MHHLSLFTVTFGDLQQYPQLIVLTIILALSTNFTRLTHIFPSKRKTEALNAFIQYQTLVEDRFDKKIKILQGDWGGEFRSFAPILKNKGIEF